MSSSPDDQIFEVLQEAYPGYPGFRDLLDRIKTESLSKNLQFELPREPISTRDRAFFIIYRDPRNEPSNVSIGVVLQAGKNRKYDDRAWNRIEESLKNQLVERQHQGYNCFVLQVWQNLGWYVVIPFNRLLENQRFVRKGDFTVKREGANFKLQGEQLRSDYLDSVLTPLFSPLIQR